VVSFVRVLASRFSRYQGTALLMGAGGVALGLGAPLGALLLRAIGQPHGALADLRENHFFYLYMALGSSCVIGMAGFVVGRLIEEIARAREGFRILSELDDVSQLPNRRAFRAACLRAFDRAAQEGHPLACLYIDIDGFKAFNDIWGHAAGDEILRAVGRALSRVCRADDFAARVGGDEFAVLMPGMSAASAKAVADRIRRELANEAEPLPGVPVRPTLSIGVASAADETGRRNLIPDADFALLASKHRRRSGDASALRALP
jgi:diguanylate cyclase (GGDEF)-like protein